MPQVDTGVPVTAVNEAIAQHIVDASEKGFVTLEDGRQTSSARYIESLLKQDEFDAAQITDSVGAGATAYGAAMFAMPMLGPLALLGSAAVAASKNDPRVCTILLLNQLDGALRRKETYLDCGLQTSHPEVATDNPASPLADAIAGARKFGGKHPHTSYGLGVYQFQKDLRTTLAIHGTGGAVSFVSDDPSVTETLAVSWLVPELGEPGFAVTADLTRYGSLKAFYEATAAKHSRAENHASCGSVIITATLADRQFDSVDHPAKPTAIRLPAIQRDTVLTVAVRPQKV